MRFIVRVALPILLVLADPARAAAHAMLEQAAPRVGSVVGVGPTELRLRFSEAIEPAFSRVGLATAAGEPVAAGPLALDPGDDRQLVVTVDAPLSPGRYRVTWRVVSRDTHTTEGDFTFEVAP